MKAVLLQQVVKIRMIDTPHEGEIFLASGEDEHYSFCSTMDGESPLFSDKSEVDIYHMCRDWFADQYDGFLEIEKVEDFYLDDEYFQDFKKRMQTEGFERFKMRDPRFEM